MRIVQDLSANEKKELLNELYESFKTGYDFENFLKPFLEKIGLKEVYVTKKSGDDGVDLFAIKPGLIELDGNDLVRYRVQAKRYKPSNVINPEKIDALRGNLAFIEKGIFITTARVSDNAKANALTKDPSKPVIVIDGNDLINICIEHQIGFAYKPVFSKSALEEFVNPKENKVDSINYIIQNTIDFVTKKVSFNDIRSRILSIPLAIIEKMKDKDTKHSINVLVNATEKYKFTFTPSRKYLGGVTAFLKKYGFLKDDGSSFEKDID